MGTLFNVRFMESNLYEELESFQTDCHEYVEGPRNDIDAVSSRVFQEEHNPCVRKTKWKFVLFFILGCVTSAIVLLPILFGLKHDTHGQQHNGNCLSMSNCANKGRCLVVNGGNTCICRDGYVGKYCEIRDQCIVTSPCYNNGTCISTQNISKCICAEGFLGKNCEFRGSNGRHFVVVFNPKHRNITFYMASKETGKCDVILPQHNKSNTISLEEDYVSYDLVRDKKLSITRTDTDIYVQINCDIPITLFFFVTDKYNIIWEAFFAFPSEVLSSEYVVPQYRAHKIFDAIGIVAIETDTIVTMNFESTKMIRSSIQYNQNVYNGNNSLNFTARLHVYNYISCNACHLTGTYIKSSMPVAVVFKSYLLEAVPVLPLKYFSRLFIVPRLSADISVGLRIFSRQKSKIEIQDINNSTSKFNLKSNNYLITNHKDATVVMSDVPVFLLLKTYGPHLGSVDNFVPGVAQYLHYYEFVVPRNTMKNIVTFIIPSSDVTGIRLNKSPLHVDQISGIVNIQGLGVVYSILSVPVEQGWHIADHHQHVRFGLLTQGFSKFTDRSYQSPYMFFAGMNYANT